MGFCPDIMFLAKVNGRIPAVTHKSADYESYLVPSSRKFIESTQQYQGPLTALDLKPMRLVQ